MRHRAEILDDGLRAIRKPIAEARSAHQIQLLTLEVLVDLRDELTTIKTFLGTVIKKLYSED